MQFWGKAIVSYSAQQLPPLMASVLGVLPPPFAEKWEEKGKLLSATADNPRESLFVVAGEVYFCTSIRHEDNWDCKDFQADWCGCRTWRNEREKFVFLFIGIFFWVCNSWESHKHAMLESSFILLTTVKADVSRSKPLGQNTWHASSTPICKQVTSRVPRVSRDSPSKGHVRSD